MTKKLLIGFFAIVLGLMPVSAKALFPDVDSAHWAAKQIQELETSNVVVGYPDGTFKPDANVTRAEFASMAIHALNQQNTVVIQPVDFTDIQRGYWAYDMIQKALYFELISCPPAGQAFRPDDSVSIGEALSVAVNALTTETISAEKAKEVLIKAYDDYKDIPQWVLIPAGKAEILSMLVKNPKSPRKLEATRPATRAEICVLLSNMIAQAKLNPNAKLAEAMRKKTGEGFIVEQAYVKGNIGILPAGSIVPMQVGQELSSQVTQNGEMFLGKAPENYITKDKYILVYKNSDIKGQVVDARKGRLFIRNGVLILDTDVLVTANDQSVPFHGVGEVNKKKNWFVAFLRKVFKGEKLKVLPQGVVYVKLLEELKIDLCNGWVLDK